ADICSLPRHAALPLLPHGLFPAVSPTFAMADMFDPQQRSEIMAKIRARNTSPEMTVRKAVHRAGFRFRLHRKDLPGTPDLVFPRHRLAVFVHGCFWHNHNCGLFRWPKSNVEYWRRKIERNVERDRQAMSKLEESGWTVYVIWECRVQE